MLAAQCIKGPSSGKSKVTQPAPKPPAGVSSSVEIASNRSSAMSPWSFGRMRVNAADARTAQSLTIGAVNDPLERAAEATADRAFGGPGLSSAARSSRPAQPATSVDGQPAPTLVDQVLESPGRALDAPTREWMQGRLQYDFSRVRVHTGRDAARSAEAVQARAFTVGSSIVFGQGEYAPETGEGRRLLAHELAHVAQQGAGSQGKHVIRRTPSGANAPSFMSAQPLMLQGHTIAGDRQAVNQLLDSQLTVGPYMQPVYLGSSMTLDKVAAMLAIAAPTLPAGELRGLVAYYWDQKTAGVRQLPALFPSIVTLPLDIGPGPKAKKGVDTGPAADPPAVSGGGGATLSPSAGSQLTVNLTRGSGPLVGGAMQRQYTVGDNIQAVIQDAQDLRGGTYQVMGGGQGLGSSWIDSKIIQLQPFTQLLAGLTRLPGNFSAVFTVQYAVGAQLTLKFSLVTIQASAGVQVTYQGGQTQPAATGQVMVGPTTPGPLGLQEKGNWWLGVGSLPHMDSPGSGSAPPLPDGQGVIFGKRF
jgi:hypothetical protein